MGLKMSNGIWGLTYYRMRVFLESGPANYLHLVTVKFWTL